MTDQTIKGVNFERYCRDSEYSSAEIARKLGVQPQSVNHWKKRGVSAKQSLAAAALLGCDPADISQTNTKNVESVKQGIKKAEAKRLFNELIDRADDLNQIQTYLEHAKLFLKRHSQ